MKVSILMAVFNGEKYLSEAINSILTQDYTNYEFIIVDDGSSDGTASLLNSIQDDRIRVISQSNQGLASALNNGLKKCTTDTIIRMDADDISIPSRISSLLQQWKKAGEPDVFGSAADYINSEGKKLWSVDVPILHKDIVRKIKSASGMPLIHPSVLYKKKQIIYYGGYDPFFKKNSEDFDLWLRMSDNAHFGNTNDRLIKYRLHNSSTTAKVVEDNFKYSGTFLRLLAIQKQYLSNNGEKEFWDLQKDQITQILLNKQTVQTAKLATRKRLLTEIKIHWYSGLYFKCLSTFLRYPDLISILLLQRYSILKKKNIRNMILSKSEILRLIKEVSDT